MTSGASVGTTTAAVSQAFREARRVDRARVSLRAGVIAAIPVVGMLALGTAIGSPTAAVTMGVGAMLTGVAWRAGDGPLAPPIATMAGANIALAVATLAGTLTGHWAWLHLAVLVVFCLAAGSATALGRPGTVIGTQSTIAFIVFGRFPESVGLAFAGAGLVFAGGACQTLFAFLVATPLAWRRQREGVAAAYRQLASFAGAIRGPSVTSAVALDSADAVLSAPALFADRERPALGDLVDEGRRLRLELIALSVVLVHERGDQALPQDVVTALRQVTDVLSLVASVAGGANADASELRKAATQLDGWRSQRPALDNPHIEQHLAALLGQVAAAARIGSGLDPSSSRPGPLAGPVAYLFPGRPTLGSRRPWDRLVENVHTVKENATLKSPAGRHAIRLAVVVAGTELLVQRVALPRGYWAVVAAATVLRPGFSATFTRGAERILGTSAGVVIATLIAVAVDPNGWGIVAVVGVLSCITYAVFSASFTAGVAGLTGIIVFLLHAVSPDSAQTALDRGIDTLIGGCIGLLAYLLWPTWSSTSVGRLLGTLAETQRAYANTVLSVLVSGADPDAASLQPLAREARIAWGNAETAVELAHSEPRRGAVDAQHATATLAALRRFVYSAHALRIDAMVATDRRPLPELYPLASGIDQGLTLVAGTLDERGSGESIPPLRRLYRELPWKPADPYVERLRPALDELIDALDTAAVGAGIEMS